MHAGFELLSRNLSKSLPALEYKQPRPRRWLDLPQCIWNIRVGWDPFGDDSNSEEADRVEEGRLTSAGLAPQDDEGAAPCGAHVDEAPV